MKYTCTTCGSEFLKWSGRCPSCGEWGTLEETKEDSKKASANVSPATYSQLFGKEKGETSSVKRTKTGILEFDRVLGGGFIDGEVILVSGEPGVGKSTLLLQIALNLAKKEKVLYIAGEESPGQLNSRVERLLKKDSKYKEKISSNVLVTDEINVDKLETLISEEKFGLVIVDSIQSLVSEESKGIFWEYRASKGIRRSFNENC